MQLQRQIRKGSTPVLILSLLAEQPMYGYQIVKELEARSSGYFRFKEGTLYPVFYRLEDAGFIEARWETQGRGKPRKYYSLTGEGAFHLEELMKEWKDFVRVVSTLLESEE